MLRLGQKMKNGNKSWDDSELAKKKKKKREAVDLQNFAPLKI
jgi:hypothetical protein